MNQGWKRLRGYVVAGVLIAILAVGVFIYYMDGEDSTEPRLSVRKAVEIFAREGVQLTKINDPEAKTVNGVKPVVYYINDTGHKLNVYHYDSIAEREKADTALGQSQEGGFLLFEPYKKAKNLLISIISAEENPPTLEDIQLASKVADIIFEKLNDTQEIVFSGAGANWEAQTVVKFYEYFYHDEDGTLRYESYHNESNFLKYLNQDRELIEEIAYEKNTGSGHSSATGIAGPIMQPDGSIMVNLGSSGGNGSILRADREISWLIKWNGQEEAFIARAQ